MTLSSQQKKAIVAAYLGWTLDAFDFFLLTFLIKDIAAEFGVTIPEVAYALFLTLAMRFIGAFLFGRLGDRIGRKPALMIDILSYSIIGAAAAFSPNLFVFLVLRALFGVAMGGEWGLGSSLVMESIPPSARGPVSGLLQAGYPSGFLLASIVYGLFYHRVIGGYEIGWRAMFLFSVLPAFVVLFIRSGVEESPAFVASKSVEKPGLWRTITENWSLVIYSVVMMMLFNFFSHGTQDLYPTFLQKQHHFDPVTVSWINIVANIGAIAGGIVFGIISEGIGRKNAITLAAFIALPALPLWAYSIDAGPAGGRRLRHADRGAGRLGRGAGASERAFAGRGARDPARLRLSGRQFPCLLQWPVPGQARGVAGRRLFLCDGAGGGRRRGRAHRRDPLQPGKARRSPVRALSGTLSPRRKAGIGRTMSSLTSP